MSAENCYHCGKPIKDDAHQWGLDRQGDILIVLVHEQCWWKLHKAKFGKAARKEQVYT